MADDDKKSTIPDAIREAWAKGEPSGWFEWVYANAEAGNGTIPWAIMKPNPQLMDWAKANKLDGNGKHALVVGCGLGDDAEGLSELGFTVTAFDISETAIKGCKQRFPDSKVDYQVVDLFKTPDNWQGHFDFVLESRTIQALPYQYYEQAIEIISALVAEDGTVLVLCFGRDENEEAKGIPWAVSRKELVHFETQGLHQDSWEEVGNKDARRLRIVYRRKITE